MMDAAEFIQATDGRAYYIESCLKAIVYGYNQLLLSKTTYSRKGIHNKIREIQNSPDAHNEIEDFLCYDLVSKYIKPNMHRFGLDNFVVNASVGEFIQNVKVGVLDIKFEIPNLTKNHYYIFEAKRIDKYANTQKYYIDGGIFRFTNGNYYSESDITVAGMIGFVEVDLEKFKKGKVEITAILKSLNTHIDGKKEINTIHNLQSIGLTDANHLEIEQFKHAYLSKHIRERDNAEFQLYHLLLDYYDILLN